MFCTFFKLPGPSSEGLSYTDGQGESEGGVEVAEAEEAD